MLFDNRHVNYYFWEILGEFSDNIRKIWKSTENLGKMIFALILWKVIFRKNVGKFSANVWYVFVVAI